MRSDLPPQDLVAERCVLACQMIDGVKCISELQESGFSDAHFYSDVNQKIQRAIFECAERFDGKCDTVLVADMLSSAGNLSDVGGPQYLIEILESVPHSMHVLHYAAIVSGHYRRREAIRIGQQMVDGAYDLSKTERDVIESAHDSAMKMSEILHVKKSRPRTIMEHCQEMIERIVTGEQPEVRWGIPAVDEFIGGIHEGSLVLVAARSGHGKSSLALQWLDEASKKQIPGIMISVEMVASLIAERKLLYVSAVPKADWREKAHELKQDLEANIGSSAPVLIAEHCSTIDSCIRTIERAIQSHGVRIVAVDYAQLVEGHGDTKAQQVGDVSSKLKQLANRTGIIVVLLAQLNRELDKREDPTPRVSDIKDSSSLEQDSDMILFPYMPAKFDSDYEGPHDEFRILVGKHRSGAKCGKTMKMRADFARQRIIPFDNQDGRIWTDRDFDQFK